MRCFLAILLTALTPLSAFAADPAPGQDREALVKESVKPDDRAELDLTSGERVSGVILDVNQNLLRIREYDSSASRFLENDYELSAIEQFTLIQGKKKNAAFPLVGALIFGVAGVALGGSLAVLDEEGDGSDIIIAMGIAGAATGAFLGYVVAPMKEVRVVLWTFD